MPNDYDQVSCCNVARGPGLMRLGMYVSIFTTTGHANENTYIRRYIHAMYVRHSSSTSMAYIILHLTGVGSNPCVIKWPKLHEPHYKMTL